MDKNITPKSENPKPTETAIKVENVSKTFRIPHEKISSLRGAFVNLFRSNGYEEFKALDDVSFEVKKGEFFGIIGRNGSGKSTLLKILAGIYIPDKGKVKVNGLISPFLELGIGFNPELSGRDNVYLNAAVLGLTHKQIDEKFDDIVEFSELRRFIDQKVKNYSSGMQVRLMFSVAIHANREILLMDEVLAVGDMNFQAKCLEEFKRYRNLGKTVLLVTHDISTVQQYCDRALLLKNGKIIKIGKANIVANEYLIENMQDQEAALNKEDKFEKNKQNSEINSASNNEKEKLKKKMELREFGNKHIIVTNVKIFGKDGVERYSHFAGEKMKIKIYYKANQDVVKPHFGIGISDVNGVNIFSTNHLREMQIIERVNKEQEGFVECNIEKIPLLSGKYNVSIYLYSDKIKQAPVPFHHINNAKKIIITNKNILSDTGEIYLDCKWNIN